MQQRLGEHLDSSAILRKLKLIYRKAAFNAAPRSAGRRRDTSRACTFGGSARHAAVLNIRSIPERPELFLTRLSSWGTAARDLVSRASPVHTAARNSMGDEGWPFEVGNQVLISTFRDRLWNAVGSNDRLGHDAPVIPQRERHIDAILQSFAPRR